MVSVLSYRKEISELNQYSKNMDNSLEWMESTSNTLQRVEDLLFEVGDAANSATTDLMTDEQRQTLSILMDEYLKELVDLSNETNAGRTIFGGTQTATAAFIPDDPNNITSVTQNPNGISGELNREIGRNQTMKINVNGDDVFQPGGAGNAADDVFQIVIDLRDALAANDVPAISTQVTRLESAQETVMEANSVVGANIQRLNFSKDNVATEILAKQGRLSDVEDTDYPSAILDYYAAQNMYDTALAIGAQIIQMSIVNYL